MILKVGLCACMGRKRVEAGEHGGEAGTLCNRICTPYSLVVVPRIAGNGVRTIM